MSAHIQIKTALLQKILIKATSVLIFPTYVTHVTTFNKLLLILFKKMLHVSTVWPLTLTTSMHSVHNKYAQCSQQGILLEL